MPRQRKTKPRPNRVRIVAGEWRHRFIDVGEAPELRPTPDRVRETLFNWLGPEIAGSRVLDLYAGTGILGLEALSRGAEHCCFVEKNRSLCTQIKSSLEQLEGQARATIACSDVEHFLNGQAQAADLVFLDPPYRDTAHRELCTLLEDNGWLRAGARLYLEQDQARAEPRLPERFSLLKNKKAGQVRFMLARYEP